LTARGTGTGRVLEQMILPALRESGYQSKRSVPVGIRPGGGKHVVDVVCTDEQGRSVIISVKWQQVSGTAEQKVPYEVVCLAHALESTGRRYHAAYLVLGGNGWTLREFYTSGGLRHYLRGIGDVQIIGLEDFVAKVNRKQL